MIRTIFPSRQLGGLLFLGILGLGGAAFRPPTDEGPFQGVVRSLKEFYAGRLPEKAYLHLDKAYYATGETIWLKAYVVNAGTHQPDTLSKVLYVDLVSGQQRVVARRTLRLRGGLAHADLALPDTLAPGTYLLRAYTNWMRNASPDFFFTRRVAVWPAQPGAAPATAAPRAADVQFFPEGGSLVAGLESEVGFKAVDGAGRGLPVQGQVLDGAGQSVVTFSSRHLGMGSFRLTPAAGEAYRVRVTLPGGATKDYPLPAAQPTGYALHVAETDDAFVLSIRWRPEAGAPPTRTGLLVAQVRGKVVFAGQGAISAAKPFVTQIPKTKFPTGLVHLTLFDEQGTAQCERLVGVAGAAPLQLSITPDKAQYGPRQPVRLTLTATDAAGQPVAAELSVAVADAAQAAADGETISSYLLLTSELTGYVEDPGYYFHTPTPESRQALSDLLLTQGWRRFVWKELLAGPPPPPAFALEQGLTLGGQLLTAERKPAVAQPVRFLQTRPELEGTTTTDAAGRFLFRGLSGEDTVRVMLKAPAVKNVPPPIIQLADDPTPAGIVLAPLPVAPATVAEYVRRSRQQRTAEQALPVSGTLLRNVTVVGKQKPASDGHARIYSQANVTVLHVGDLAKTGRGNLSVHQYLQGRVPGLAVTGGTVAGGAVPAFQIRSSTSIMSGNIPPIFFIDGSPVTADVFASYPVADLETIEVLNQNAAGIFGGQAYGGVIAAYTRLANAKFDEAPRTLGANGVLTRQIPGYYQAREFYAPRYETASAQPDPRYTTLYWNPSVRTDASGKAQLIFYTSDATGAFQASAEGITPAGQPGQGTARLEVRR